MTIEHLLQTQRTPSVRTRRDKRFLMCRPDHFAVTYSINPWMDPVAGADRDLAVRQWDGLRDTYLRYGHTVEVVAPVPGLPDMVFAANGGIVHGGRALAARFVHPERQPEGPAYNSWFDAAGFAPAQQSAFTNEGEGDFLFVGELLLGGTGFRTSLDAHREVEDFFGVRVLSLELVDPRFYHLDTALTVLDESTIAYYPAAFSEASRQTLEATFPDAILATDEDAEVFALNAMSDGLNVFLTDRATGLRDQLAAHGFNPVGIDLSELLKAGGSVKCCTLELHR